MLWECVSCETCVTRCPQQVDIPAMIDALRQMSVAAAKATKDSTVPVFNDVFLRTVRRFGRMHEIGLMASYKTQNRRPVCRCAQAPDDDQEGKTSAPADAGPRRRRTQEPLRTRPEDERERSQKVWRSAAVSFSGAFYPGCSLEGSARDFHVSTLAVARTLGVELPEIPDWTCCGSSPAHQSDPLLALALPAKNLAAAAGRPVAVCCASCYSRLKAANHAIAGDAAVRRQVAEVTGVDYDGRTPVLHLLEILARDVGLKVIARAVKKPLEGLRVVCYYGCLLSRPPEVTNFDNAENPTLMDQVMRAAGAESLDWPHKTECCGAGCSITNVAIVHQLTRAILSMARAAGADCVVTACPLCQMNLDLRQADIEAQFGEKYQLPTFYFTQLLGLAFGLAPKELGLGSLVVDPLPLLAAKGLAGAAVGPRSQRVAPAARNTA